MLIEVHQDGNAADGDYGNLVTLLIANGADIERRSDQRIGTALYAATPKSDFAAVRMLIEYGA